MKTTDTHAFVNQFLVCLLVTFCFSGSIGLGTVWMRQQISATANANRKLAARIADLQRRINETNTVIEGEQTSDVLRRRNADWRLGLELTTDTQVVRMPEDPVLRLARRHNRDLFNDNVAAVSFTLAAKN
jgi:hypothetical protein